MFEYPGLAALSTQLEIYRWEDHVRQMDNRRHAATMDALFQEQYINRYNALVQKFNNLLSDVERYDEEMKSLLIERDRRIAQLEQELTDLRAAKTENDENLQKYAWENARRAMNGLE